jgi:hypothetical protein
VTTNARSIATLGIGFGVLAVATIGFSQSDVIAPPVVTPTTEVVAGGGGRTRIHFPREIETASDIQHEDDIMLAIIMQAVTKGIL